MPYLGPVVNRDPKAKGRVRWTRPFESMVDQDAVLIIPAPTVTPVASSMRMNEPVERFLE